MARCGDCIHYEACIRFADVRIVLCGDKADERCKMFKHTADVAPRAEVAREIFEELDKWINANKTGFYSPHGNYMGQGVSLGLFGDNLAELKKKYTEGTNETRN